ncbi:hypothetical protein CspeluHIS016_0211890 [Cutaneotrichosporon spelunceum]|uniref:Peptidase A1 domain-containing protein n=1 Tax=Cutaneotrichosporon spelunceum TaxID=1672016 RepID=A0AAD3TT05_9TREE|nr:hypothetical protein CspeluHIS016_0211890 [Cutaneotrichosporon spelunceum]
MPLAALLLVATASAAASGGAYTLPIRAAATDEHSPDPAVRFAWFREEAYRARLKYADVLGLDKASIMASPKRAKRAEELKNWGSSYSVPIEIGTPPQTFDAFVDTGSTDMWVVTACKDPWECGMSKAFVPSESSTYEGTGRAFSISYVKGETRGEWANDTVGVGGTSFPLLFGVADQVTEWRTEQSALMGFAFTKLSQEAATPWWLTASETWPEKRWGMYLARTANWTDAIWRPDPQGGQLTFGGIDKSKMAAEPTYFNLLDERPVHWTVPSRGLGLNGQVVNGKLVAATTDSGTSLILGPDADVREFYNALDHTGSAIRFPDGSFAFQCGPDITANASFSFVQRNGPGYDAPQLFNMWDGDLVFWSGTLRDLKALGVTIPSVYRDQVRYCLGNIVGWDDPSITDYWLVGSPFLRNVYSIYETDPVRHGLAPLTPEADVRYGESFNPIQAGSGGDGLPGGPHDPSVGGGNSSGVVSSTPISSTVPTQSIAAAGRAPMSALAVVCAALALVL